MSGNFHGKKPGRYGWPEVKKLCRLNQNDIAMAKRLGLGPDALIRSRPDPRQKWKLPVKDWIHELHLKRFGHVIGEKPLPKPVPMDVELDEEAMRALEEQMYWEDYRARNQEHNTRSPAKPADATGAAGSGST